MKIELKHGIYVDVEGHPKAYVVQDKREPHIFHILGFHYEADGTPLPDLLPVPRITFVYPD